MLVCWRPFWVDTCCCNERCQKSLCQCVDKPTRCNTSYEWSLLPINWLYMFRTITSPSSGASSHELYSALVRSCYQASLAVAWIYIGTFLLSGECRCCVDVYPRNIYTRLIARTYQCTSTQQLDSPYSTIIPIYIYATARVVCTNIPMYIHSTARLACTNIPMRYTVYEMILLMDW